MSGPKVDKAEIRRQERELIERKRNERINGIYEIEKLISKFENTGAELTPDMEKSRNNVLDELKKYKSHLKNGNEMTDVNSILEKAKKTAEKVGVEIRDFTKERNFQRELNSEAEKGRDIVSGIRKRKFVFKVENMEIPDENDDEQVNEKDVRQFSQQLSEKMNEVINSGEIPRKSCETILMMYEDLKKICDSGISSERKIKRIRRMGEDFEKVCEKSLEEYEDMKNVYDEYLKEFLDSEETPRPISSFGDENEIRKAIETEQEKARERISGEYVRRQIDEIMEKHGYKVVHSELLKEMNEKGQILYGIDDDTAVDVFVSDSSQVTMRVVGIGFDSEISDEEDEELYKKQCAFCSMHPQIVRELEMRGVILRTVNHLPPSKKFNKKIKTGTGNSVSSQSRAKKELKRREQRVKYKGNTAQ